MLKEERSLRGLLHQCMFLLDVLCFFSLWPYLAGQGLFLTGDFRPEGADRWVSVVLILFSLLMLLGNNTILLLWALRDSGEPHYVSYVMRNSTPVFFVSRSMILIAIVALWPIAMGGEWFWIQLRAALFLAYSGCALADAINAFNYHNKV